MSADSKQESLWGRVPITKSYWHIYFDKYVKYLNSSYQYSTAGHVFQCMDRYP
jgi:hypothetical protein